MNEKLKEKISEALSSVIPITVIVLILSVFVPDMTVGTIVMFLFGALLLIVGMGFFSLGAEMAMLPLGEGLGVQMTKTKKLGLIAIVVFLLGAIITISEPDLQVLAKQVPAIPDMTLILTIAVGVGIFLVLAILRILFKMDLSKVLIILYAIVIVLSFFVSNDFVPMAFDSGGVTTGPVTVPFIMAMGLGLASVRGDKGSMDDSFGLVALCSIGPILAVLILGIYYNPTDAGYTAATVAEVDNMRDVLTQFVFELPNYAKEVSFSIIPILMVFIVFQVSTKRFTKKNVYKIIIGFVYTLIGLILFLTGVNVGFIPVGQTVGFEIAASNYKWLLIPLGMVVGYFIVAAEPAVHVLNKQVEDVSDGAIPATVMKTGLSVGVAISLGISMLRILTGISIYWFLIPGYVIALVLTFFVPKIFTGIAFDSGGVASGPMTSTFLLPFAIGACQGVGGNLLTDAFGIVAMVAMTPLITIQIIGLVYKIQRNKLSKYEDAEYELSDSDEIIEFIDEDSMEEELNG